MSIPAKRRGLSISDRRSARTPIQNPKASLLLAFLLCCTLALTGAASPVLALNLGGVVAEDVNKNGLLDAGDRPLPGVEVTVRNVFGLDLTAFTDAGGVYRFVNLPNGFYNVHSALPFGFQSRTPNPYAVTLRTDRSDVNFLLTQAGSISGAVIHDLNGSGVREAGEPGIPGVQVDLVDALTTAVVRSVMTREDGTFTFLDAAAGSYLVVERTPPGFASTGASPGPSGLAVVANLDTIHVTLLPGQSVPGLAFLDQAAGPAPLPGANSIEGFVFNDLGADDQLGLGDFPLSGVSITLRNAAGVPLAATVTGPDGRFQFHNLVRGVYLITETDPPGFFSLDAVPGSGGTALDLNTVRISMVEGVTTYAGTVFLDRQGLFPPAGPNIIKGAVFDDANGNGDIDVGECPLPNVLITLQDAAGSPIATRLTSQTGGFAFAGLPNGTYIVTEADPPGFASVAAVAGAGGQVLNANTIRVTTTGGAVIYGDQLFLDRSGAVPVFGLSLTKAVDRSAAAPGDLLTYTLAFTHTGGAAVNGAVLFDVLPAGTQFVDASSGGVLSGNSVVWGLPVLPPGSQGVVSFRVRVLGGSFPGAGIVNQAQIILPGQGVTVASNIVTTIVGGSGASLTLAKAVDRPVAQPGDVLTYTLSYANVGGSAVEAVILDPLPPGLLFLDASMGGALNAGAVRFNLGTLAPGAMGMVSFRALVVAVPAGVVITNQAAIGGPSFPQPIASNAVTTTIGTGSFVGTYKQLGTFPMASITVDPGSRFTVVAIADGGGSAGVGAQGVLNPDGSFDVATANGRVRFTGRVDPASGLATVTVQRAGAAPFTVTMPKTPDFSPLPPFLVGTFVGFATNPAGDQLQVLITIDPTGNATFQADLVQSSSLTRRFRSGAYQVTPDGRLGFAGQIDGQLQPSGSSLLLTYNYTGDGYQYTFQVPLTRQ